MLRELRGGLCRAAGGVGWGVMTYRSGIKILNRGQSSELITGSNGSCAIDAASTNPLTDATLLEGLGQKLRAFTATS
jgi:hypothetical protein